MFLPNLLQSRRGRLGAFFLLYVTEGIPLGFAAIAVATQLRRQGVGPAAIGAFVASFYLPWAFKWAFGPLVDVFASERLGRRRGWILVTQVLMALTLLASMAASLPEQLALFTAILLLHNTFAAIQDVAIDALAVDTLHESERGLANGLMFAGAMIGQMIGGSGVLFLSGVVGFAGTFWFVAGTILCVTVFVVLPMREPAGPPRPPVVGPRLRAAAREMRTFAVDSFRAFMGTRGAFLGLWFALLPAGAYCLNLSLQSNLAVELGMNDDQVAWLGLWSGVVNAAFCVLGGWLSDRYGRRRMLSLFIALMGLPVLYMAWELQRHGWIMPVDPTAANRPAVPTALLVAFWIATLVYLAFNGLMYGTRSAAFMDVTNPKVAATQFTAYMALMNLTIAYTANWQGIAVEAWGYPITMLVDVLFGLVCLLVLPWMGRRLGETGWSDASAGRRARLTALLLAAGCAAWVPYALWHDVLGVAQPIAGTLFTLVFVGSAVFLLAAAAVVGSAAPALTRLGAWLAPLLLLMHARNHTDSIAGWLAPALGAATARGALTLAFTVIAAAGALVLLRYAFEPWRELATPATAEAAA